MTSLQVNKDKLLIDSLTLFSSVCVSVLFESLVKSKRRPTLHMSKFEPSSFVLSTNITKENNIMIYDIHLNCLGFNDKCWFMVHVLDSICFSRSSLISRYKCTSVHVSVLYSVWPLDAVPCQSIRSIKWIVSVISNESFCKDENPDFKLFLIKYE